MSVIIIDSNSPIPIEKHFRISAGPGAGKTHWLVSHVENVLQNSKRLGCNKRVACITYTNVAVETILKRMHFVADRVEVTTIHGFIYANIVKPYFSFIASDYNFKISKLDGHDEHFISRKKIVDWLTAHPNGANFSHPFTLQQLTRLDQNIEAISGWLRSLRYVFNGNNLELAADNTKAYYVDASGKRRMLGLKTCLAKLAPGLMDYKKQFWEKGILHHDDVLFFGCLLLQKYPFIATVLRAKFPYFFVDEFQDTSPIQAAILGIIGQSETIVGVIGDKAQSIYSFQGAEPAYFNNFTLPGIQEYLIEDNRRSTSSIVSILNHVRTDIVQQPIRDVAGAKPILFVGGTADAVNEVRSLGNVSITSLSRNNITANALRREMNSSLPTSDLVKDLTAIDNGDRRRIIISCLTAIELAKQRRFKEALKETEKNFLTITDKSLRKKWALKSLSFLTSAYDSFKSAPLYNFYELIKANIRPDIVKLTRGAARTFFDTYTYEQVAVCASLADDDSASRTIHKAKGDEFDNVLLILKKEGDLKFLLEPSLITEEPRVFYVGISRAKQRLFINAPSLTAIGESKINHLFDIVRLPTA